MPASRFGHPCLWSAILLCLLVFAVPASSQTEYITNGKFETGSFAGWQVADLGNGSFFISTPGTDTPGVAPDFFQFETAPNPYGGAWYAVSASGAPGAHALFQDFTIAGPLPFVSLSFQMFVNDQSFLGPVIDPTGLDPTTGGLPFPNDNQHARVDILRAGASDFSTDPLDILGNFYLGIDNACGCGVLPNPYLSYYFDITSLVGGGGTFRLRFAEVDNLGSLNMGVDNVHVSTVVPEGSSVVLMGIGALSLLCLGACRRKRG